jgi:hypothetical protein
MHQYELVARCNDSSRTIASQFATVHKRGHMQLMHSCSSGALVSAFACMQDMSLPAEQFSQQGLLPLQRHYISSRV